MSNYLSRPYQTQNPVQRGDINFDAQILSTLQTRYDQGKALVDQTLAQYESLRALRDTDNEYIATKINQARNMLNGNIRYEHQSQVLGITNSFKNILKDPIVQDAIYSKAVKDNFDLEAQKRKEKGDGSYSDLNYQYGLYKGGFDDYMAGKSNKLGVMSYENYTDYRKELKDIADNIEKYDTDIEKSWIDGQGYIYTQKGKVITEDKIKSLAESFLSDGAKKQLTISGWGSIHQGRTEEERQSNTIKAFEEYSVAKLADENEKLLLAKAQAKKTGSEQDIKNAEIAQENYTNIENRLKDIKNEGSYEQMYGTVYKDTTLTNFAKTMAYNTVDITDIKGDTTYMSKVKMEYDRQRDAVKDAQWEADYNLKLKKAGLTLDSSGNPVGDGSAFQTKADFGAETPEAENVEEQASKEIEGLNTIIDTKTETIFNNLDKETQDEIDSVVRNSKGIKTRTDVLIDFQESGVINVEDAIELNNLVTDRYAKQEVYNKYAKQIDKEAEAELETDALYEDLYNKPDIKIMWKSAVDGKEKLFSAKEVLINTGSISKDGKKLKTYKAVTEAIKKSMLADKTLSARQVFDYKNYLSQLASALGEDINKIIVKGKETYRTGYSMGQYYGAVTTPETLNPNSKTAQFLEKHRKGGGYNIAGILSPDDSFDDISTADNYFRKLSTEQKKIEIGKRLMQDKTVTFGKVTTVMPGTTEYKQIAQQVGFDIKSNIPIEIKQIPDQPNMVTITIGEGSSSKVKPTEVPNIQKIRIEDLHPNILNQVNFYNTKNKLNVDNFPPMFQRASFSNRKGVDVIALAEKFYGGNDRQSVQKAKLTTVNGATNFYFSGYEDLLGTIENPTKLGSAVKNIINSQDTYIEVQKTKSGSNTYLLPIIKKGNKEIFSPDPVAENLITNENADIVQKTIKFIPQEYINRYLITVLSSENKNEIDKIIKLYGN